MEMNELRYFLAVAKTENMQRAAGDIGVSAGSLSKAISKLENELQVKLFKKVGRNIVLTDYGRFLKQKGNDLITLESSIKTEIMGQENSIRVKIAGSELALSGFGLHIADSIKEVHDNVSVQFDISERSSLISKVRDGEVDIGISTYDLPSEFDQKTIADITFNTFISPKHPLGRKAKKGQVDISEVLEYPFVVPQNSIFGRITKCDSVDGWRDDKFPRKISYYSSSLKTIENLIIAGKAIAYLPDFYGNNCKMLKMDIKGCPYYCKQKLKMFTRDKGRAGWLNALF